MIILFKSHRNFSCFMEKGRQLQFNPRSQKAPTGVLITQNKRLSFSRRRRKRNIIPLSNILRSLKHYKYIVVHNMYKSADGKNYVNWKVMINSPMVDISTYYSRNGKDDAKLFLPKNWSLNCFLPGSQFSDYFVVKYYNLATGVEQT